MFISHFFGAVTVTPFPLIKKKTPRIFVSPRKKKMNPPGIPTKLSNDGHLSVLVGLPRCYMLGTQSIQTSIVTVHHLTTIRQRCQGGLPTLPTVFGEVGKHKKTVRPVSQKKNGGKRGSKTGKQKNANVK